MEAQQAVDKQQETPVVAAEASTPCIGVCTVDQNDVCVGCFRSCAEIAAWASLSEAQRRTVMAALPARRDAYFA